MPLCIDSWTAFDGAYSGWTHITSSSGTYTPVAAFENESGLLSGVQFHPEVLHSSYGQEILRRWLIDIVKCKPTWTSDNIIENEIINIKSQVENRSIICGLSGGVDSAVAAALVQKAVGSQLTCVFVDHGLLREGEAEQVERDFVAATGVNLMVVDAQEKFLAALKGVTDPEEKRKIIGREFIRTFEEAAAKISEEKKVEFLVQGTLYPDVVESGGGGAAPFGTAGTGGTGAGNGGYGTSSSSTGNGGNATSYGSGGGGGAYAGGYSGGLGGNGYQGVAVIRYAGSQVASGVSISGFSVSFGSGFSSSPSSGEEAAISVITACFQAGMATSETS